MSDELKTSIDAVKQAGVILRKYFRQDIDVAFKSDKFDPVTQADTEADAFLRHAIAQAFPNDQILSEEYTDRPASYDGRVWMIDPLDGTKDYVAGRDGFSIIIGLLVNNVPIMGVVYVPARDDLFYAQKGQGAFHVVDGQSIPIRVSDTTQLKSARLFTRFASKGDVREIEQTIDRFEVAERIQESSIGTKVCLIASGQADLFINTNLKACKWDTLGGQVILEESGGAITDINGQKLDYAKPTVGWETYFAAASSPELLSQTLKALNPSAKI